MDNITAANAYGSEDITTPEETGTPDDITPQETGDAAGESTTAESTSLPAEDQQDVTRTQAFAQRLRERTDREIASAGLINPYTGERVMNASDLRTFVRMQDAEANGRDPQSAAGEAELRERLAEYQLKDQEGAILADPELAPYYEEYREDVLAIADGARANGSEVDLGLALRIVMAQNYSDIRKRDAERIREEVIKSYNNKSRATPGAIGGSDAPPPLDFSTMSDTEFEEWQLKALRGELSKS